MIITHFVRSEEAEVRAEVVFDAAPRSGKCAASDKQNYQDDIWHGGSNPDGLREEKIILKNFDFEF